MSPSAIKDKVLAQGRRGVFITDKTTRYVSWVWFFGGVFLPKKLLQDVSKKGVKIRSISVTLGPNAILSQLSN